MRCVRFLVLLSVLFCLTTVSRAESAQNGHVNTAGGVGTDIQPIANAHHAKCSTTTDCVELGLAGSICQNSVCVVDKLFPLSKTEIYGSIAAFVSVILAAGSGLGGGGLLVPGYLITMGLSSHEAIPLSKATIFGSAIASFIINVRSRHPLARDRPLIDYETMLMMEPMTLAGTIIGVNMNKVFPEWLITVCIVWLLTKTSMRTFAKGKSIWAQEGAADKNKISAVVSYWRLLPYRRTMKHFDAVVRAYLRWKSYKRPHDLVKVTIANPQDDERSSFASTVLSIQDLEEDTDLSDDFETHGEEETLMNAGVKKTDLVQDHMPTLDELQHQRNSVPMGDMFVLLLTWIGLVLFSLAKGGHGNPSIIGLQCGSVGYWGLVSMSFPFFVAVTMYYGIKIARTHTLLRATGFNYLKGDMVWTKDAIVKYPALCTAAGLAAGLLGIGGGMVKGPLLLEMGLIPQVASATSSSMILFTSSATTIQFIIMGTLSLEHALWHGCIGFVAGVIGQFGVSYLIRKYRKTAFVIFLIAAVVGVSGGIMGVLGAQQVMQHGIGGFRSLCHST